MPIKDSYLLRPTYVKLRQLALSGSVGLLIIATYSSLVCFVNCVGPYHQKTAKFARAISTHGCKAFASQVSNSSDEIETKF